MRHVASRAFWAHDQGLPGAVRKAADKNFGLIQFGAMGAGDLTAVAADMVVSLVRVGIAGAVIGLMLGRK